MLRIDNGGDLCKKEFEEFYKKCGIIWQNTTPCTPHKNRVTEIMNRDVDGKGKKHAQWCRVRIGILGRGSGDCMLPS